MSGEMGHGEIRLGLRMVLLCRCRLFLPFRLFPCLRYLEYPRTWENKYSCMRKYLFMWLEKLSVFNTNLFSDEIFAIFQNEVDLRRVATRLIASCHVIITLDFLPIRWQLPTHSISQPLNKYETLDEL